MGRVLDSVQVEFAKGVAKRTGLHPEAIGAWCLAEEGPGMTVGYNCLNCLNRSLGRTHGFSGVSIAGWAPSGFAMFRSVSDAITETSYWINEMSNYSGIRAVRGQTALVQVEAIANSPWDAGHYHGGASIRNTLMIVHAAKCFSDPVPKPPRKTWNITKANGAHLNKKPIHHPLLWLMKRSHLLRKLPEVTIRQRGN